MADRQQVREIRARKRLRARARAADAIKLKLQLLVALVAVLRSDSGRVGVGLYVLIVRVVLRLEETWIETLELSWR